MTGGSEGIGLAAAQVAVDRGARVSLVARRADVLEAAAAHVGGGTRWASADVSDAAALEAAIAELTDAHGPVDVLLTSAGYARPAKALETPVEEFRRQMEVNYLGTVHAVAAVAPSMVERRSGHLVLVSSTAGLVGVFGYSAYAPTKFAVRGLGESLRSELRPHGVRVSVVYPPDTDTPGFAEENRTKPPETAAISGSIAPRPAEHVALAIIRGVEHDRLTIVADPITAVLARGAGLLAPAVRTHADRVIERVQSAKRHGGARPDGDPSPPDGARWRRR